MQAPPRARDRRVDDGQPVAASTRYQFVCASSTRWIPGATSRVSMAQSYPHLPEIPIGSERARAAGSASRLRRRCGIALPSGGATASLTGAATNDGRGSLELNERPCPPLVLVR